MLSQFKIRGVLGALTLFMFALVACEDRVVTNPDFRYDLNRPSVSHIVPVDDAVNVPPDISIQVWFSKVINEASVEPNFSLYPVVMMDTLNSISHEPDGSGVIYAGGEIHGVFRSEDGGQSWRWMSEAVPDLEVTSVLVGSGESYVLAGTYDGLYRTDDAGANWSRIADMDGNYITYMAAHPDHDEIIYATVGTSGVYKSNDSGLTWSAASSGLRPGVTFTSIIIDSYDQNRLFVSTDNDFVYKSDNAAASWQQVRRGLGARNIQRLFLHGPEPGVLFAGSFSDGIYRSDDFGDNWVLATGEISEPVVGIVAKPGNENVIYAGTTSGIWRSPDSGETWIETDSFQDEVVIKDLAAGTGEHGTVVAAGLRGPYVWDGDLFLRSATVDRENLLVAGDFEFEIWSDTLVIVSPEDYHHPNVIADSSTISPYVPSRALQGWIAGGRQGEPPVDINPDASKMTFHPSQQLKNGFVYRILVEGTFETGGNVPKGSRGVEDRNGNTMEEDTDRFFSVEPDPDRVSEYATSTRSN